MSQLRLHSALILARPEGRGCIMLPWLSSSGGLPGKANRLLARMQLSRRALSGADPDIRRAGSAKQLGNVPTIMVVSAVNLA